MWLNFQKIYEKLHWHSETIRRWITGPKEITHWIRVFANAHENRSARKQKWDGRKNEWSTYQFASTPDAAKVSLWPQKWIPIFSHIFFDIFKRALLRRIGDDYKKSEQMYLFCICLLLFCSKSRGQFYIQCPSAIFTIGSHFVLPRKSRAS